ncbi:levanase [Arthrobacter sp. ZBG10]|uniref:glycoside hydrolase family 32 protein n=1 Tax=Arthrobacter sp. ZBG10 TaxID=1676590 RepID=UPI00068156CC|nr:glycoside hydrolase family 32 protein [Arthrobacter sp. ZBG10]KNH15970.1 levanase [Arthrobacter sp. ZBG10]
MPKNWLPSPATATRSTWLAVALSLSILLVGLLAFLPRTGTPDAGQESAETALGSVAAAQAGLKASRDAYGTYWLAGGDRTLEAGGPVDPAGAEDLRSISCADGWVAAARTNGRYFVRSSEDGTTRQAVEREISRPDCITPEATAAMLADLGKTDPPATPAAVPERPAGASPHRPAYHITPGQDWMNDPQRPFFLAGRWHYYYLYNADYPEGNGTEWYHLTSTDLVTWQDEGVAIPKYKNGLGDIETGSTVVDYNNTAGFGEGAVIAVLTQQDQGVQRQSLFHSTDGGYSFTAFDANPVMENPGETHWRDPKIIRDEANGQWLMTLAEGGKLGIYTSTDLKSWRYTSSVELPGLGTLECPDLFQLDLDGDPAKRTWVLAASGNGAGEGGTTGVAYWTGGWDGTTFTPAGDGHQWLDAGSDFYAAVTWDDPRLTEGQRMQSRQAIGWVNNWDYARKLPTADWHGGMDSIVRDLRLKTVRGKPTLVSTPARALAGLEGPPVTSGPAAITPDGTAGLPAVNGSAYRLDLTLEADGGRETGAGDATALLQLGRGEAVYATIGYDFAAGTASVSRKQPADGTNLGRLFTERRTARAPARDGSVDLTVFVDHSSVEVFVNGGEQALTSLVFPGAGVESINLVSDGPGLALRNARYAPLGAAR